MEREQLVALVTAAQTGDQTAFNKLYAAFRDMVYTIALRETKNPDTADDVTQDSFVEVIRTIGKLQEPAAFVSWLKTIVYHQCTAFYRKKENKHEMLEVENEDAASVFDTIEEINEEFIPDKALDNEEFCRTIRSFILNLPDAQRAAVMMKYFEGLSVKEIAEVQGVSENTVISRLYYARNTIKQEVESYEKKHDIKLHAIPFFPLFKALFANSAQKMSAKAAVAVAKAITAATGVKVTVAGAGVVGAIWALPAAAKIGAGVTAAAIIVTAPIAIQSVVSNDTPAAYITSESTTASTQGSDSTTPGIAIPGSTQAGGSTEESRPTQEGGIPAGTDSQTDDSGNTAGTSNTGSSTDNTSGSSTGGTTAGGSSSAATTQSGTSTTQDPNQLQGDQLYNDQSFPPWEDEPTTTTTRATTTTTTKTPPPGADQPYHDGELEWT